MVVKIGGKDVSLSAGDDGSVAESAAIVAVVIECCLMLDVDVEEESRVSERSLSVLVCERCCLDQQVKQGTKEEGAF